MAAIGATAAGMHVAGAVTPVAAAMAVKYGIVAISGGTGGRRFGWGNTSRHTGRKKVSPRIETNRATAGTWNRSMMTRREANIGLVSSVAMVMADNVASVQQQIIVLFV